MNLTLDQDQNPAPAVSHLPPSALLPDAPIHHWLSLRTNPNIVNMSQTELRALVENLKQLSTSPPTLSAKLSADGEAIKPRAANGKTAARNKLLADL